MRGARPDEKTIFNAARRLGRPDARRRYLERACGADPALHARVNALLRVHDEDGSFLTAPAVGFADTIGDEPRLAPGAAVGPYTLLGELGMGGMGVVYLAEQDRPVRRQVALKAIRPGTDSRQVLARFEAERRALALMDHPNIARVFDAGTMPGGRSYIVMELVRGVPITRYCDQNRLTPRRRLDLFLQVCRGVQHAHQKGVVHRDLKPSNILVTLYDGKPVPKIIDFGLAKAVGRPRADSTLATGFVVGTLEYMSPEQADPGRHGIDTRSDIYSLGVLLYELLTGSTPLSRGWDRDAGLADVLLRIGGEEPPQPSARLRAAADLAAIAAARGLDPGRLVGRVRGDLDWIVMKCLEKDRARRYQTADGLARDVERHLADEPVEASPPSPGYRLRKFARRHRAALAAAAAFGLLVLGGAGACGWLAVRATTAERAAVAERDRKEAARRYARQALDKLTDETVERLLTRQARVTDDDRGFLRQVLALHEEFAAAEPDSPEDRAGVADARFRVGLIRHRLGEFAAAEEAYRAAIDLQRPLADEYPGRLEYRRDLGRSHLKLGSLLRVTGRPRQAEEAYAVAVAVARALADEHPGEPEYRRDLAAAHNNLGNVLAATGRPKEAEAALRTAVDLLEKVVAVPPARPDDRRLLVGSYQNLAAQLLETGRPGPAEDCYLKARDLLQKLAAEFPDQPDYRCAMAQYLNDLGALYTATRRRPQAEESFRAAAAALQKLTDEYPTRPEYRKRLAASRSNLGNLLSRMKQYRPAEEAYLAARDAYVRLAADYPQVSEYESDLAKAVVGLALLKSIGKDDPAALRLVEEALPHDQAALRAEPKNPTFREAYRTHRAILAEVLGDLGDHARAADAADELVRVGYDPAADAVTAAWVVVRCVPLAHEDGRLTTDRREELARSYADRAVAHVRTAVRHGYRDAARLATDPAFAPIRSRDDFQSLLRELRPVGSQ
ncbi:MAG TPA: serine/threonine-protein kinase [Gemmataceae bacterium]|jgi:serine/threonine protein kinase